MKRWKKRIVIGILVLLLGGTVAWIVLGPGLRQVTHNAYHKIMTSLGLGSETGEGATFWCPMHPEIRRQAPGTCPICSMALVPLAGRPAAGEPGILRLTDRQVQQAGVRTGTAKVRDLVREIDATGRIAVDERRLAVISSWISGKSRIERLHVNFTGATVKQGQVLIELYSPTLVTALDEYRVAIEAHEAARGRGIDDAAESADRLVESARTRLIRFGLTSEQVTTFEKQGLSRTGVPTVPIKAPLTGTVLERLIEQGQYVIEGDPLLRIADLTHLWLYVDIYEYELPFVALDQKVEFTTRSLPGKNFEAQVDFIDPVVQERTRTVRIRCDLENAAGLLKPGMYARVRIRSTLPGLLSVPESSVLQSGRRNIVIVSEGTGRFRPKLVQLGRTYLFPVKPTLGDKKVDPGQFGAQEERYHEVLSGLSDGDRVVMAGNFLLNAEAQFQGILKKMMIEAAERSPKRGR